MNEPPVNPGTPPDSERCQVDVLPVWPVRIRLIASDLDGTLLRPQEQAVAPQNLELLARWLAAGGGFVAASGRQYANLRRLFGGLADRISYIAENGSLLYCDGRILDCVSFPDPVAQAIIARLCQSSTRPHIVLSGVRQAYCQAGDEEILSYMREVVGFDIVPVPDLAAVPDQKLKISMPLSGELSDQRVDQILAEWRRQAGNSARLTYANGWLDLIPPAADKGRSLRLLVRHFGISLQETAVFGDSDNDCGMLALPQVLAYAMSSARPLARQAARGRCCSRPEVVWRQLLAARLN
ncbi:HAD family phosphatase [Oscillospiraceae bacterium HV4-5-C5C]|nr:HAD family phosphatase [Oscillospiraceae bacterium HV4-5-C5C]